MDSITLTGLAAIVAAVVGPMLGCVLVMMRYQHKDNVKTHDLIGEARQETRDLIAGSEKETRDLIAGSEKETRDLIAGSEKETRDLIAGSEKETRDLIAGSEKETRKLIELHGREHSKRLDKVVSSVIDSRERLARIEGHLGIGSRPAGKTDSDEAEAA